MNVVLNEGEAFSELPNFTRHPGYEYQVEITPSYIAVWTTASNSASVLGKYFTELITYEL